MWFVRSSDGVEGPLNRAELIARYRRGQLLPASEVADASDGQYLRLATHPELHGFDADQKHGCHGDHMACAAPCMPRDLCGVLRLLEAADNARGACTFEVLDSHSRVQATIPIVPGHLTVPLDAAGRYMLDALARAELLFVGVPDTLCDALGSNERVVRDAALAQVADLPEARLVLSRMCVRAISRAYAFVTRGGTFTMSRQGDAGPALPVEFATQQVLASCVQMHNRLRPGALGESLKDFAVQPRWACLLHRKLASDPVFRVVEFWGAEAGTTQQLRLVARASAADETAASRVANEHVHGVVRVAEELVWVNIYRRDSIVVAAWPGLYLSVVVGTLVRLGALR